MRADDRRLRGVSGRLSALSAARLAPRAAARFPAPLPALASGGLVLGEDRAHGHLVLHGGHVAHVEGEPVL